MFTNTYNIYNILMKKSIKSPSRRKRIAAMCGRKPSVYVWSGGTTLSARRHQIQDLLDKGQPFVLAKYALSIPLVEGAYSWAYELIIWQTREGDDEQQSLLLEPIIFRKLIKEFDMKAVYRIKEGEVYACNSLMADLCLQYRHDMAPAADAVVKARYALALKPRRDMPAGSTRPLWDRLDAAEAACAEADRRFVADNDIHLYRFSGERDGEGEDVFDGSEEEEAFEMEPVEEAFDA